MADLLTLLLCTGAGLIGGVFFGFSSFVMKALAGLPAAQGAAAMQRINVVVLNPLFLGVFVGTAVLSLLAFGLGMYAWHAPGAPWLAAAGLWYGVGCFGVTLRCNVPRNEQLARVDAACAPGQAYWSVYLREWVFWNHVRTVAATLACASAAAALAA